MSNVHHSSFKNTEIIICEQTTHIFLHSTVSLVCGLAIMVVSAAVISSGYKQAIGQFVLLVVVLISTDQFICSLVKVFNHGKFPLYSRYIMN